MFILRGISLTLSTLGYILAGTLIYFCFYPLEYRIRLDLNLDSILDCDVKDTYYKLKNLDSDRISEIKAEIGNNAPIDLISNFMFWIDSLTQLVGSSPELNLQYCDIQNNSKDILEIISSKLIKQDKYYEIGLFNNFVKQVNEIPFVKVNNIQLNIESIFARTNVCNSAISKMKMYLFTIVNSEFTNIKRVVLFKIGFSMNDTVNTWQKFVHNLVTTGHYFKARYKCKT